MSGDPSLGAAEYVLGTLDAAERAAFAERLARDPRARQAVRAWERRLAPLATAIPSLPPDPGLWSRIEQKLGADVIDLRRSRARWRMAAAAFGALAACLAVVAVVGPDAERPAPPPAAPQIAQAEKPTPRAPGALRSGEVQTAVAPREQGSGVSLASGNRDGGLVVGGGTPRQTYVATLARPAAPELAFRYDRRTGAATMSRLAGDPRPLQIWLLRPGQAALPLAFLAQGAGGFAIPGDLSLDGAEIAVAASDAPAAPDAVPSRPFLLQGRILPE